MSVLATDNSDQVSWDSWGVPGEGLLEMTSCGGADAIEVPVCKYIGTDAEGWYVNNKLIAWPNGDEHGMCEHRLVECLYSGLAGEGWYVRGLTPELMD